MQKVANEAQTFKEINFSFLSEKDKRYKEYQDNVNRINQMIISLQQFKEQLKSYYDKQVHYLNADCNIMKLLYDSFDTSQEEYNLIQSLNKISFIPIKKKYYLVNHKIRQIQENNILKRNTLNANNSDHYNYSLPITYKTKNEVSLTINSDLNLGPVNHIIQLSNGNIVSSKASLIHIWYY